MTPTDRDAALAQASVPTLLMCLAQITRDDTWLKEPFLPKRDISIFAEPTGGLSPQAQQAVREAIARVLDDLQSGARTLPPLPDEAHLVEMMSVCLGERVPPEYAPLAMEEMGYRDRRVDWHTPPAPERLKDFKALVIGAGFTGLCAAYRLKEMGFAFEVVEKNAEVGGTWWENTYPESGVDTPNHFYSYSYAPNTTWTSNYSKRDEMLAYQRKVTQDQGLREHIEFETEVVQMRWLDDAQQWEVQTRRADGSTRTRRAAVVISCVGALNSPKLTAIKGIDSFTGPWWHSARWQSASRG